MGTLLKVMGTIAACFIAVVVVIAVVAVNSAETPATPTGPTEAERAETRARLGLPDPSTPEAVTFVPTKQALDRILQEAYACAVDTETDTEAKGRCLAGCVNDLGRLRSRMDDHEESIARRFVVLLEPGTPFMAIRDGIRELRLELWR